MKYEIYIVSTDEPDFKYNLIDIDISIATFPIKVSLTSEFEKYDLIATIHHNQFEKVFENINIFKEYIDKILASREFKNVLSTFANLKTYNDYQDNVDESLPF